MQFFRLRLFRSGLMRAALTACVLAGAIISFSLPLLAEPTGPSPEEQRQADYFSDLVNRVQKSTDPDETIKLVQEALSLEGAIRFEPRSRRITRGLLLEHLADAYSNRTIGDAETNREQEIAAYEAAIVEYTQQEFSQKWALMNVGAGVAYAKRTRGDRAEHLERAVRDFEAALQVFTREKSPRQWAMIEVNLAAVYAERIGGSRRENIESSIACFEAALFILTRENDAQGWAKVQVDLANAYTNRIVGNHSDNMEKAIKAAEGALTVFDPVNAGESFASAQINRGIAYLGRTLGDRAKNLQTAIDAFHGALSVWSRESAPDRWALAQSNLAFALVESGAGAEAMERAIAACEDVLTVLTSTGNPLDWARIQLLLGRAYMSRIGGDPSDNSERALQHTRAALTVLTPELSPQDWAHMQNNLGTIYYERIAGDREENLKNAISAYQAALTISTFNEAPIDWAETQSNLGAAYASLKSGDLAANRKRAIAAFEAANTGGLREAKPNQWAMLQHNLAVDTDDPVRATALLRDALSVVTINASPQQHIITGRLLAKLLIAQRDWEGARQVLTGIREAFLTMFGLGLNEADAVHLLDLTRGMFAEAAFVSAELGRPEEALDILNQGRGRLMDVSLRLNAPESDPKQQAWLNETRSALREKIRRLQSANGANRTQLLDEAAALRKALLNHLNISPDSGEGESGTLALSVIPEGGAIVAPIITDVGAKLVVAAKTGAHPITTHDVPDLNMRRIDAFMNGRESASRALGWRAAYAINYRLAKIAYDIDAARLDPKQHARVETLRKEYASQEALWWSAVGNLGHDLWDLIGKDIVTALKARGVEDGGRIIWLPSGALGLLPLTLAQDPQSGQYFGEIYETTYAPNLEMLKAAAAANAQLNPASLAAVINPTGDLPFTKLEGALVAAHFRVSTLLQERAATPEHVIDALKGRNYWHFSSHGSFSWKDARQSALLLSNGQLDKAKRIGVKRLTVSDLLDAQGLGRPRLVVLSACETGLYDVARNPDEFTGLSGAFMSLGAVGVLGSLWPVDDRASSLLIARFYDFHLGEGLSPPTALMRAQAWLRGATRGELLHYAREVAREGHIDPKSFDILKSSLSRFQPDAARLDPMLDWKSRPSRPVKSRGAQLNAAKLQEKPFSHPYFWGAFVYTGL